MGAVPKKQLNCGAYIVSLTSNGMLTCGAYIVSLTSNGMLTRGAYISTLSSSTDSSAVLVRKRVHGCRCTGTSSRAS